MKKIWLIRHGETDFNKENRIQGSSIDAPLNSLGKEQAKKMAIALTKMIQGDFELFSSSMSRARQTAEFLCEVLDTYQTSTSNLEEMNYGDFEGKLFSDIEKDLNSLIQKWDNAEINIAAPNGESPLEVKNRAVAYIMKKIESSAATNLIFVVHGRVIRILLAWFLDHDLSFMQKYPHQNANINELSYSEGEFSAQRINYTEHLLSLHK